MKTFGKPVTLAEFEQTVAELWRRYGESHTFQTLLDLQWWIIAIGG